MKPTLLIVAIMSLCNCYLYGQKSIGLYAGSISLVGPSHYRTGSYRGHSDLNLKSQNLFAGASVGLTFDTNRPEKSLLGFYFSVRCDYAKFRHDYYYGNWVDEISNYKVEADGIYEVQALSLQIPALLCMNTFRSKVNLMAGLTYRRVLKSKVVNTYNETTNYFQIGPDPSSDYYPYVPPITLQRTNSYKRNFQKVLGTIAVRFQNLQLFNSANSVLLQLDFPLDTKFQAQVESNERLILHLGLQVSL